MSIIFNWRLYRVDIKKCKFHKYLLNIITVPGVGNRENNFSLKKINKQKAQLNSQETRRGVHTAVTADHSREKRDSSAFLARTQPVKSQGLCFLSTSYLEITSSLFMATSLWFVQGPGKTPGGW